MKKFFTALLTLQVLGIAFAQEETHPYLKDTYIGYEAGMGKAKIPSTIDGVSVSNIDNAFFNSRVFLGKSFNDSLAVEAGYYVGGRYAATFSGYQVQGASSYNLYDMSLVVRPFTNKQLFLTGGTTYGEDTGSGSKTNGWGTTAGIGYEIPIYSNTLRFTYRKYISPSRESFNLASYNLGLVIPFDEKNPNKFQDTNNGKLSVGLLYSFTEYKEPELSVKNTGRLNGILFDYYSNKTDLTSTKMEARYSQGLSNYSSANSGNDYGHADTLLEVRLTKRDLFSKLNINLPDFYSGIGYRKYDDDARGVSTAYQAGYRRSSQYFYIPLGMEKNIVFNNHNLLAKAEYDFFVSGNQKSYLSDTQLAGYSDVQNKQTSGYGLRGSLSFNQFGMQFIPFVEYWSIGKSEVVLGAYEPKNATKEIGLKVFKSF
jgi:hypothetical protein